MPRWTSETLPLFANLDRRAPEDPADTLDPMAERDLAWLGTLRAKLVELYEHRRRTWGVTYGPAFVTADDVRRIFRLHPELLPPAGVSNKALGNVFRAKGWRAIGYTRSTQSGAHGNTLRQWTWDAP